MLSANAVESLAISGFADVSSEQLSQPWLLYLDYWQVQCSYTASCARDTVRSVWGSPAAEHSAAQCVAPCVSDMFVKYMAFRPAFCAPVHGVQRAVVRCTSMIDSWLWDSSLLLFKLARWVFLDPTANRHIQDSWPLSYLCHGGCTVEIMSFGTRIWTCHAGTASFGDCFFQLLDDCWLLDHERLWT
jgi:hypothetical protein